MGPVIRVLMNLIQRQGLQGALKTAQSLGFRNKDIKIAMKSMQRTGKVSTPRNTFRSRKADRKFRNEQAKLYKEEMQAVGPTEREYRNMFRNKRWQEGQTGDAHPVFGIPGIDF
jgi:hypothetical protein